MEVLTVYDIEGGAAAIIIRERTKEIICVKEHIGNCSSSSQAEVVAYYLGILLAKKYKGIREIKTDSTAVTLGYSRTNTRRQHVQDEFRFWFNEGREILKSL